MANNIVLIGMPGTGKTTIGLLLQEEMTEYTLIDTDTYIEKCEGLSISDIFSKFSEDYFRKLEYDAIKTVCVGNNKIISIGGGAFENPDTRCTLLNFGKVFYLKSNLDVLYYRISKENKRPLLEAENPHEVLQNLLAKREANYQKAHQVIDTSVLSEDEIVKFIIGSMDEKNS